MFDDVYCSLLLSAARPHKKHHAIKYRLLKEHKPREIRRLFHEIVSVEFEQDPSSPIGLDFGTKLSPVTLCDFTRALTTSKNLSHAAKLVSYPFQSMGGSFYPYYSEHATGNRFSIMFPYTPELTDNIKRFAIEAIFSYLLHVFRFVFGKNFEVKTICLPYEQPSYVERYTQQFGKRILFDKPVAIFEMEPTYNLQTFSTFDQTVNTIYTDKCIRFWRHFTKDIGTTYQVINHMIQNHPQSFCIEEIANGLHCSVSWLQKKLKQKDLSYRELCKRVRIALLQMHIMNKSKSQSEVAVSLGFSNTASFNRFLKKELGCAYEAYQLSLVMKALSTNGDYLGLHAD